MTDTYAIWEEEMRKVMRIHDALPPAYRKISSDTGATVLVAKCMVAGLSPEKTREYIEHVLHRDFLDRMGLGYELFMNNRRAT